MQKPLPNKVDKHIRFFFAADGSHCDSSAITPQTVEQTRVSITKYTKAYWHPLLSAGLFKIRFKLQLYVAIFPYCGVNLRFANCTQRFVRQG